MSHYEFNIDYPLDDCAVYTHEYHRYYAPSYPKRKDAFRSFEEMLREMRAEDIKYFTPEAQEKRIKRTIAARREWEKQQKTKGIKK